MLQRLVVMGMVVRMVMVIRASRTTGRQTVTTWVTVATCVDVLYRVALWRTVKLTSVVERWAGSVCHGLAGQRGTQSTAEASTTHAECIELHDRARTGSAREA